MTEAVHDSGVRPLRLRRRWLKIFLLASVILACGIVIGMAIMFRFVAPPMKMQQMPERMPEFITQHLRRDLALDDDQTKAVREIFKQDRAKLESIRIRVDSEVLAQMEASQQKIDAVLRPDQREPFDKRFEKIKDQFRPDPNAPVSQDPPASK